MSVLKDLLAKVEAGADRLDILQAANLWAYAHGNAGLYVYVLDAYYGSLDAAKALHDAVLPGFEWIIGKTNARVYPYNATPYDQKFYGLAELPARAWLIAILRALIAQGGEA